MLMRAIRTRQRNLIVIGCLPRNRASTLPSARSSRAVIPVHTRRHLARCTVLPRWSAAGHRSAITGDFECRRRRCARRSPHIRRPGPPCWRCPASAIRRIRCPRPPVPPRLLPPSRRRALLGKVGRAAVALRVDSPQRLLAHLAAGRLAGGSDAQAPGSLARSDTAPGHRARRRAVSRSCHGQITRVCTCHGGVAFRGSAWPAGGQWRLSGTERVSDSQVG